MVGMTFLVAVLATWVLVSFLLGSIWAALRYTATPRVFEGTLPTPREGAHDAASARARESAGAS